MITNPVSRRLPLPMVSQKPPERISTFTTEDLIRFEQTLNRFDLSQKARKIPAVWYTDPRIAEAELKEVFGRNWVAVGRADEAGGPLSFFQRRFNEKRTLVYRDKEANLKAFANACRHQLYPLVNEPQGILELKDGNLQCKYHGWEYDLSTGENRRIPEPGKMSGVTKEDLSLIPFEVGTWGPLVFVRTAKDNDSPPLSTILAPIMEQTANRDLSSLKFKKRVEYTVPCNWKVYIDNFLDGGYHVPIAHPGLAPTLDYGNYRTHIFDYSSLQQSPTKATDDSASSARTGGDAMYWWIFPNVMVNIYKDAMDTNIVLPYIDDDGIYHPDKCRVIFDFYFADDKDESFINTYIYGEDGNGGANQVQLEDEKLCRGVQSNLRSGIDPGFNMKRETGIRSFHELLARNLLRFRDRVKSDLVIL